MGLTRLVPNLLKFIHLLNVIILLVYRVAEK